MFYVLGVGKSKKLAKRNAANAMLQTLKSGMIVPDAEGEGFEEDGAVSQTIYFLHQEQNLKTLENNSV